MTPIDILSLFVIMLALAVIPSSSVALVVTRSATSGLAHGVAVALGIVLGDLIFILLAMLSLSTVAETMGGVFLTLRYLGAAYLLWLGFNLFVFTQSYSTITVTRLHSKARLFSSFLSGSLLTLGDIKALFFYLSLLPGFIDLGNLKSPDLLIVMLITVVTVGGVKIAYALSAHRLVRLSRSSRTEAIARKTAGSFMLGAGCYLILKS
jgi:threonine/homoserine/homoserine lactone efflux protein